MHKAGRIFLYVVLIACGVVTLVPLVWMVAACFKQKEDFFHYTFFEYGTKRRPKRPVFVGVILDQSLQQIQHSFGQRVFDGCDVRISL